MDRVQVLRFQARQRLLFLLRQMIDVLQEDVAPALDLEVVPRLLAPHLVDRLVGELDDVEFVERDLGVREALFDPRVLAVGDVDHLAPRHVDEQADVVVAAPRRSLVGGDAPHLRQIKLLHRPPDVMFDDAPQARVGLAEQPRRIGDRHCLGQRQHEGLKQQREARARASPRRDDLMDATLRTPHPRRARVQQRAMLEEIQMPPSLVFRVMDRAAPAPALRAGEPAPPRKIHVQIEPTVHRVERAARHHPRRRKTKGQLEKIGVLHPPG